MRNLDVALIDVVTGETLGAYRPRRIAARNRPVGLSGASL